MIKTTNTITRKLLNGGLKSAKNIKSNYTNKNKKHLFI